MEKQEPLWHEETVADVDDARERMSLKIFLSQFNDFMIWVLLVTAITAILILNALLGFRQEVVVISG